MLYFTMVEKHTVHQKHNAILKLQNEIRSFKIRFYKFDYQFYHRLDLVETAIPWCKVFYFIYGNGQLFL